MLGIISNLQIFFKYFLLALTSFTFESRQNNHSTHSLYSILIFIEIKYCKYIIDIIYFTT